MKKRGSDLEITVDMWELSSLMFIHKIFSDLTKVIPLISTVMLSSCSLTLQRLFTSLFSPLCGAHRPTGSALFVVRATANPPAKKNDLFLLLFLVYLMPPRSYSLWVSLSHRLILFHIYFTLFHKICWVPQCFGLLSLTPHSPSFLFILILTLTEKQWSIKCRSDPVRNSLGERGQEWGKERSSDLSAFMSQAETGLFVIGNVRWLEYKRMSCLKEVC